MKRKIVVSLFVIGLLIMGCIFDNDDQSSDDSFSLNVRIVDEQGVPVPNLNITFLSPIELSNNHKSRAQTTICFELAESCFVTLAIENIEEEHVRELISDSLVAGSHAVQWNGEDDFLQSVPSGTYFCRMRAESQGIEIYNDRIMMYLLSFDSINRHGVTDLDGNFICTSYLPFPSFYDLDSLICTDGETGAIVDTIAFPDSIEIYISDPDNPNLYQTVRILPDKYAQQDINIEWQPQEISENNSVTEMNEILINYHRAVFPFFETELNGNYPNPFN